MTQKIQNGFLQFHEYTLLRSRFIGTLATQADQEKTDIDLVNDTIGDQILVDAQNVNLLQVVRDGASLIESQGFELIAPNVVRIHTGLLQNETVEFKMFTGASGIVETIPTTPPTSGSGGYDQTLLEAMIYTDGSESEVNAFAPVVVSGKTQITTHFPINEGRVDVFINGTRVGIHSGVWSFIDSDTIELNDNYSSTKMRVEIVKQIVG